MTEGRRQMTEGKGGKPENQGNRVQVSRESEGRRQMTEVRAANDKNRRLMKNAG